MARHRNREIGERLKSQVDTAFAEYQAASAVFDSLVHEVPSGIPSPDGELNLRKAGMNSRAALDAYVQALRRLTAFMATEAVPEDVKHYEP